MNLLTDGSVWQGHPRVSEQVAQIIEPHAPMGWINLCRPKLVEKSIREKVPIKAVVMVGDIRSSTILMRESIVPEKFADTMTAFIELVKSTGQNSHGMWFDKFTGDGFLGYWLVDENLDQSVIRLVMEQSRKFLRFFETNIAQSFYENLRNVPRRSGLSIGIDSGEVHLLMVGGMLTIVGRPVVGAVRMVGAAKPYEMLANYPIGSLIEKDEGMLKDKCASVKSRMIKTKEFPDGQQVWSIIFEPPELRSDGKIRATIIRKQ